MDCCSKKIDTKLICSNETDVCPYCKTKAKHIGYKTILMQLKYPHVKEAKEGKYFICMEPNCDVVYFSSNVEVVFFKKDLRTKIGIKKKDNSKTICYCFDITEKDISDEIKLTGESKIYKFIKTKTVDNLCACSIKNPLGKCCLSEVKKIISATNSVQKPRIYK